MVTERVHTTRNTSDAYKLTIMLSFKIKLCSGNRKTVEKRRETSVCERKMILQLHNERYSYTALSKVFNRSRTTIASIIQRSRAGKVANGN